ncbi:MAG: hypothetical protein ACFE96_02560 [Candidatus Hermodarchaeota archaeon]
MVTYNRIKNFFKSLIIKISNEFKQETVIKSFFKVEKQNVKSGSTAFYDKQFARNQTYLQTYMTSQFLKYSAGFWTGFQPVTISLIELLYNGQTITFPYILGQDALTEFKDESISGGGRIMYRNMSLAGPIPYCGSDITLFVGLVKRKTDDGWIGAAFNFIESIGKATGIAQVGNILSIAGPIVNGIETLLGIDNNAEIVTGVMRGYSDDTTAQEVLEPGYYVQINKDMDERDKALFYVKDDLLYKRVGDLTNEDNIQIELYTENDYLLYRVECLTERTDLESFDFHRKYKEAEKLLKGVNASMVKARLERENITINQQSIKNILKTEFFLPAEQQFDQFLGLIAECYDLTEKDREGLPFTFTVSWQVKKQLHEQLIMLRLNVAPSVDVSGVINEYLKKTPLGGITVNLKDVPDNTLIEITDRVDILETLLKKRPEEIKTLVQINKDIKKIGVADISKVFFSKERLTGLLDLPII